MLDQSNGVKSLTSKSDIFICLYRSKPKCLLKIWEGDSRVRWSSIISRASLSLSRNLFRNCLQPFESQGKLIFWSMVWRWRGHSEYINEDAIMQRWCNAMKMERWCWWRDSIEWQGVKCRQGSWRSLKGFGSSCPWWWLSWWWWRGWWWRGVGALKGFTFWSMMVWMLYCCTGGFD